MAFWYAFCSSVSLGAFRPSAPAIMRLATASVFSGRGGEEGVREALGFEAVAGGGCPYVGDTGVGGGAAVPCACCCRSSEDSAGQSVSVSVSEPEETSSSSHESATSICFGLGLESAFLVSAVWMDSFATSEEMSAEAGAGDMVAAGIKLELLFIVKLAVVVTIENKNQDLHGFL